MACPTTDHHSIIDWAFADLTPIQRAAGLPRFLWPPPSMYAHLSPVTQSDREAYMASFSTRSSPATLHMRRWQNPPDVDFRTLYIESLFSKGMHFHLAQAGWKRHCPAAQHNHMSFGHKLE
jgi:hypothetical protein